MPRDKPDYLGNDHFVFGDFNGDGFPDLASHRKRDDDTFIRYGPDFATIETIGDIKIDSMTPVDTDGDGDDELFVVAMLEEQEAFRSGDEDFEYWYRREYQMLERDGTWSARVVGEPERYAPRIEGTNIGANPDPRTGQSSVKAVRPLDFDHDGVLEIITIEEHAYAGRQINREDCGQNTFEGEPCGELTSVMIDREPATGAYRIGECGKNRLGRIEPGTSCPGTASTFEPPFNGQFVDLWGDYNGDANYDVAFVHTSRINTGANTGRDVIHNGDGWTENVLFEDDLRFSGAVAYPSEEGRLAILARNGLRYARYDIRDRAYQTAVLTYGPDATPIPATLTLSVGDLDGNGAADLIGSDGSVYLRTFGEGLLLKEVRHGVNALTNGEANISINYTWPDASDVLSTEALANEVAPSLTRWQLPQWRVVSSMSAWSPEGQITSEYRYEGPLASRTRRWLGFRRVMRRTVESGDISVDVYDHSGQTLGAGVIHPYRARPIVSERISGAEEDDPRIQESEMRYIAKFGPDGTSETLIVCADNSITRTYERAGRYEASELAESLSQLNVGRFRGGVFRRLTENVTNWECDGFGNTTSADTISRVSDSEPFRGLIDAPGMAEIAQSGTRRTSTLQLSDRTDDVWLLGRVDSTTARTWSGYCQAKQFLGAALDLGVDVGMLCPASDLDGEIVETATSRYCDGADAACPTNSPNLAWQTTFDADGRASTVTREFDLDGNVVAQSQLGVADFDENVVERRIEYAYDEVERLFVEQTINRSQDSPPLIASQLWDTDLGVATLTRDVQGVVTVNTFDGFGQVTSSTVRGDSSIAVAYTRASDSTQEITMQDETGASSTMSFDVLGRLTKRRESVLAGQWSEQHYQYDPLGRQVGESPPTPAGETPTYFGCEYDTHDRARRCLTRDNGVLSFDFDGLVQTLTLPDGAQRSKGLDQDGRSLVITNEEGAVSRFIYDAYGRLARYIDPGAQDASVGVSSVFKSDYDARGNLMMIEDPINGLIEYAYSDFNDLVYSRTNVGEETYRFYDSLSRVTAVRSDTHSIDYTYDFGVGASMGTLVSSTRRSVLNESVSATRSYERDLFGRVVRVDESVTDGAVVSTASSIVESFMGLNDSRVNRFSYATSSGVMTASYEYELDFTKRLSVAAGGVTKTLWQAKERDAWGNVETGQLGEWLDVSRSFYADTGRLRDSTIRGPSAAGGASVAWTEDAFFNTRGFLERKDWTLSGVVGLSSVSESHAYRYDGVGRLTKEVFTDSTELELTYDFIGNMRTRGSQVFTPDSSNPYRLAGATYDDAGRVTDIVDPIVGALSLTGYTTEDLPTVVTSSSGSSVEFEYGPTGARVLRREGGRTNHYFFDGTCEDKRSGGALQESACTFFVEGEPVSTVDLTLAGQAEFHVVVADRLGSGVLVAKDTDDGVEVESYLEYSPWGEVRQSWGDRSPADPDSPVGFTGHRDEFGIGMIDMRGRFYMPGFARFATPDPVVFNVFDAQAYQGYAYVRNNPNAYTDPSGFSPEGVNCTPRTCGFAVDEGAFITEGPPPEDGKGDGASAGEARPVEQTADSGPEASPSGGGNGEGTSGAAGHGKTESGGGAARGSSTNGPEGVAGRGGPRGGGSGGGGGMDAMAAFASLPSLTISGASSSFGANLGAFTKGFADGFVSGLAVKVGLGLVAATFGAPVATGIGIAALAYGLYNTDFGALRTSITNIGSGNGTPADFEAAGELASMVVGVGRGRGGGGRKGAPANPTASGSGRGRAIPDQTLVCRGGMCTADNFSGGSGVTTASNGTLAGVSTQSRVGASVETLAQPFRNGQVGVTTVGDIRAAGGRVVMDGTVRNPNHATVSGITAQQAEALFTPTIPNPVPKPVRGTIPQMTPNN
ncbi:MAG: RHS repeat-associated core domain-containing protein [Myxococcota bacterium]